MITQKTLNAEIETLKAQLLNLGPMRPGKLSVQYHNAKEKTNPYYQISFTFRKKSYTNSVREVDLKRIKEELDNYVKFKSLNEELVAKSLELSKLKTKSKKI